MIGLIAGVLASLVVRGSGLGFLRDIVVGLIGAGIGGLILHAFTHGAHTSLKIWKEMVVAFVGAVILLFIIKISTAPAVGRPPAASPLPTAVRSLKYRRDSGRPNSGEGLA